MKNVPKRVAKVVLNIVVVPVVLPEVVATRPGRSAHIERNRCSACRSRTVRLRARDHRLGLGPVWVSLSHVPAVSNSSNSSSSSSAPSAGTLGFSAPCGFCASLASAALGFVSFVAAIAVECADDGASYRSLDLIAKYPATKPAASALPVRSEGPR